MSGEVRRTSRTPYVSTGHLPSARQVQATVDEAYRLYRTEASGAASQTYPALARVPGQLSGICVAGMDGGLFQAGDSQHEFTIMSVAKPLVLRWCARSLGAEPVRQKPGVNATGLAFNSLTSVERSEGKWAFLAGGLSRFAGRELTLSDEVHASASETSHRNRAIANLLASRDRIYWDPAETVDLYTRQSCLLTSAKDLAVMTATLADGGGSPVTRIQVITRRRQTRWPSWPSPGCTRPRVTGFSALACRQERDRRRDHRRLAGHGRHGHLLPAPGAGVPRGPLCSTRRAGLFR